MTPPLDSGAKDTPVAGETTGHEWDGIRELDTPLPKWWLYVLYATIVFAAGYCVLYPAIPLVSSHSKGLLGYTNRQAVRQSIAAAGGQQPNLPASARMPAGEPGNHRRRAKLCVARGESAWRPFRAVGQTSTARTRQLTR